MKGREAEMKTDLEIYEEVTSNLQQIRKKNPNPSPTVVLGGASGIIVRDWSKIIGLIFENKPEDATGDPEGYHKYTVKKVVDGRLEESTHLDSDEELAIHIRVRYNSLVNPEDY